MYCAIVATTCLLDLLAGCAESECSTGEGNISGDLNINNRFSTENAILINWIISTPAPSTELQANNTTEFFSITDISKIECMLY